MKSVLCFSVIFLSIIGCSKEIEDYIYIFTPTEITDSEPDFSDSDNNSPDLEDGKGDPSESKGGFSYSVPDVKTASDFAIKIYFDPDYTGENSDGSIERPFTNMNVRFADAIPANTAFLFKRGTTHEKIGRLSNGSQLTRMIYNNNLIGAYGEGQNPVIEGIWVASNSDGLSIRDLNIQAESQAGADAWDIIINLYGGDGSRPSNVTIAFNTLNGVYNPNGSWTSHSGPRPYPHMGIRGGGKGTVIYNNIISNVGDNGIYFDAHQGLQIVRNYIYNVNRMNWGRGLQHNVGGDCIQIAWSFCGAYVAGNYLDPGRDYYDLHPNGNDFWKHSYIANASPTGGWDSPTNGTITEYNTFISPPTNTFGMGPVVYYNPPKNSVFRNNFIAPIKGINGRVALAGSNYSVRDHLNQDEPHGIYDNIFIRHNSNQESSVTYPADDGLVTERGNLIFSSWSEYLEFIKDNDPVGSDIDPDDFWSGYTFK